MEFLKSGKCNPKGLIKKIMQNDLHNGFLGNLDKLAPNVIANDDIYIKNRRTKEPLKLDLGIIAEFNEAAYAQYAWWNAESQGNWIDGLVRTAILLDDDEYIKKATDLILHRLGNEKYIGIYTPGTRYKVNCENGELWAKTTILRAAYALYCYNNDSTLLERIINAVDETMDGYKQENSTPFAATDEADGAICHGISHGLMFVDVLYDVWKETKNKKYLKYAEFLYDSFGTSKHVELDAKKDNLFNNEYLFKGHSVHSYEHLRAVALSKDKEILIPQYFEKLDRDICPSGAAIGDEWILPTGAEPSMTGYEYCSIHELLHSYLLLLELSGDLNYADKAEWLLYNAALGARHPEKSLIAYLKSDNSYSMQSGFQFKRQDDGIHKQTRYKYSPTHQDVAICCVPNAGRIFSYFTSSMWLQDENSITKVLYGDSILHYGDIAIEEKSNFPIENKIKLIVTAKKPTELIIRLRIPNWCKSYIFDGKKQEVKTNTIEILRTWNGVNEINIEFIPEIIKHTFTNGEVYFSYGGLLLALPIKSEEKVVKTHILEGFYDYEYSPIENYNYVISKNETVTIRDNKFFVNLINESNGLSETKELVPLMNTILRKVTFKEI